VPTIAIDLAVLLPTDIRAVIERVNARFDGAAGNGFRFDTTHHPHVTLSQHFIDGDRLTDVCARVSTVLSGRRPLDLRVTSTRGGRTAQVLVVAPTPALQQLHEQLMDTLAMYELTGDADAFQQDDGPPRDGDVAWVTNFRTDSSAAQFDPHITVGIGTDSTTTAPFTFTARTIAVCRLGRFCTCRDQLACWTL
jgi:2'-5' RNA ligase